MALWFGLSVSVLLLAMSLLACLYSNLLYGGRLVRSAHDEYSRVLTCKRAAVLQNVTESDGDSERLQSVGIYGNLECTTAPEGRFDCGRDRVLSQGECEERGCCYAPLHEYSGPPWCFYPSLYPGYKMGPLTPTKRGQTATLTRTSPSYLPKDVSTLSLEVTEETAGCLHITVSTPNLGICYYYLMWLSWCISL